MGEIIRDKLIPAVIGRKVSDVERRILALPVRYGGLGIANLVLTADREYNVSVDLTENLTTLYIIKKEVEITMTKKD